MTPRLIDRDELWKLCCLHYWDGFQRERDLILCHIEAILRMIPDDAEVERLRFVVKEYQIANRHLARDLQALGGSVTEIISETLKINP